MLGFDVFVSSAVNPEHEFNMVLSDYANKDVFWQEAKRITKQHDTAEAEVKLAFDEDSILSRSNLISENHIDDNLWDYLALSDDEDDIEILIQFMALFPDQKGSIAELYQLAKTCFVGAYSNPADFGYAYLDDQGHLDNLPKIIENNIDIEAITEGLMMTHKQIDNWYYSNPDQDGWRLKGA